MEDFGKELEFIMKEAQGSSGFSMERDRPYDGQPHTDDGIRGKTVVEGLTMRDVADCIVLGFLSSTGIEMPSNPIHDDMYKINLENIDPGAVIQNALCHIEKMMGIYPNVPGLDSGEADA